MESSSDKLPAVIFGTGPREGKCTVSIEESSQFASALLLCAKTGGWNINIVGENAEESPYVAMTTKMIDAFPNSGGTFQIEPDASSGSYFLAAKWLGPVSQVFKEYSEKFGMEVDTSIHTFIEVANWPHSAMQIDAHFEPVLLSGGDYHLYRPAAKSIRQPAPIRKITRDAYGKASISRKEVLGDSIMTAIVLSALVSLPIAFRASPTQFTDLSRLRLQETERVVALRTELTKCGARVIEEGDTLTVYPSELHGAEIETYNDHRMAMCFAILGLKVPGIKIKNPACVKKTFPNFFQKLAAAPPKGLGATILDAKTGRKLEEAELFAD